MKTQEKVALTLPLGIDAPQLSAPDHPKRNLLQLVLVQHSLAWLLALLGRFAVDQQCEQHAVLDQIVLALLVSERTTRLRGVSTRFTGL